MAGLTPAYQARSMRWSRSGEAERRRPARTTAAPRCPPARGYEAPARVARRAHEVTVIDDGYEHQGKRYRSLSAVARAITGTQWSGPLFFGLRKTGGGG